jgi:surface antigen
VSILQDTRHVYLKEKIMKIRSSLAAIIAVCSVVLLFGPAAHATEKKDVKKDEKPPVVMVTIQEGDTLSSTADAHSTTYERIFDANDSITNPDVINVGDKVRIPAAAEELPDRFGNWNAQQVVAPAPQAQAVVQTPAYTATPQPSAQPVVAASSAGNTYYQGYCTWYAKQRRPDLPNMLGNGGQWVANAAARGYATGTAPRAGSIAEIPGHVAYVEAVNGDGTIVISEMNGPAGFGVVGTRTVPASQYRYIY